MTGKAMLALVACCGFLGAAGCGSSSSSTSSSSGTATAAAASATSTSGTSGSSSIVSQAQKNIQTYFADSSVPPPSTGPAATKGKTVAVIDAGLSTPAGAQGAAAAKEAGKLLGWKVNVFDGQFTPSDYQEGIRQAVSSKVDGIIVYGVDCPVVKTALEQAKQAGIPVVNVDSQDCNEAPGGGPQLFTSWEEYPPLPGTTTPLTPFTLWGAFGQAQADWLIAKTDGKAKVIFFDLPDFAVTAELAQGFEQRIKQCSGCSILDTVKIGVKDLGPSLQGIASQALLKNPDANAVEGAYSDPITLGIAAAVRASGRSDKLLVTGGNGLAPELDLVRENKGEDAGFATDIYWDMYSTFDQMNRVFAHAAPAVTGYALTLYDKDHNLPASGGYVPKVDYKAAFEKIWSGGQ
jgi:ribose transport system substrate-binding protein